MMVTQNDECINTTDCTYKNSKDGKCLKNTGRMNLKEVSLRVERNSVGLD